MGYVNCGFWATAVSMGQSSNKWADIRREIKNERMANPTYLDEFLLKNVWGDKYEKMIEALSLNGSGSAPLDYWMTFPGHGYLLADTYQRPVVLFSKNMSTTYLPISHPPTPHSPICLIVIYFGYPSHYLIFFQVWIMASTHSWSFLEALCQRSSSSLARMDPT